MDGIKFDMEHSGRHPAKDVIEDAIRARQVLESRKGPGNDFLGWLDLPEKIDDALIRDVEEAASMIRKCDGLVVVGIGGSYLGARAVIDALTNPVQSDFPIHYAGHHLDSHYHSGLLENLSQKKYAINVISKSGTTTEPGLAFRFLWEDLSTRISHDEMKHHVVATTDAKKGSLRALSDKVGLKTFVIPDDVGGRYSVLTPVGLLPIAAAGLNVGEFVNGAREMMQLVRSSQGDSPDKNPALAYASYRNGVYRSGKKIEIMASYRPSLHHFSEWWKQLFGESEGKDGKGIYPASVDLTTDLHSMGQWIQDGERSIFETVIDVISSRSLKIPKKDEDSDGLNYLAGRDLHDVNRTALKATMEAHASGGVPVARLEVPDISERTLGAMMYMFEYACGISAYMLGVNPFDQPGVEAYKKNMFRLLGKPGVS